ncbi:hypothetical protein [Streptomyces vilmorinianum]|uniref:hypothetical protein n=1 Tax=Streptomyces vilmorinianum TaxID=3051092 RepID=UPI0010FAE1A9|nr:hypothetical protein [Streptomyces vilmorinianum]
MTPGAPDLTNEYDGPCAVCGAVVPAGTGALRHGPTGGWEVFHRDHVREPAPPARQDLPGWHRRRLMALDIATTGNRAAVDRILAAAVRVSDGTTYDWIMDPGSNLLSLAPGKSHGVTIARARAEGAPAPRALDELATVVADHLASREVLVVWFAPHVLATLHAELLRHGVPPLTGRLPHGVARSATRSSWTATPTATARAAAPSKRSPRGTASRTRGRVTRRPTPRPRSPWPR